VRKSGGQGEILSCKHQFLFLFYSNIDNSERQSSFLAACLRGIREECVLDARALDFGSFAKFDFLLLSFSLLFGRLGQCYQYSSRNIGQNEFRGLARGRLNTSRLSRCAIIVTLSLFPSTMSSHLDPLPADYENLVSKSRSAHTNNLSNVSAIISRLELAKSQLDGTRTLTLSQGESEPAPSASDTLLPLSSFIKQGNSQSLKEMKEWGNTINKLSKSVDKVRSPLLDYRERADRVK
jgi:hypothetical protein